MAIKCLTEFSELELEFSSKNKVRNFCEQKITALRLLSGFESTISINFLKMKLARIRNMERNATYAKVYHRTIE